MNYLILFCFDVAGVGGLLCKYGSVVAALRFSLTISICVGYEFVMACWMCTVLAHAHVWSGLLMAESCENSRYGRHASELPCDSYSEVGIVSEAVLRDWIDPCVCHLRSISSIHIHFGTTLPGYLDLRIHDLNFTSLSIS